MDTNDIHEDNNLEEVEVDKELYKIELSYPEVNNNIGNKKEWRKCKF